MIPCDANPAGNGHYRLGLRKPLNDESGPRRLADQNRLLVGVQSADEVKPNVIGNSLAEGVALRYCRTGGS